MKKKIASKLIAQQYRFTDKETNWLMLHLGDPDPTIRDEIVFQALASGIIYGGFTIRQFLFLKEYTITHDLMRFQIDKGFPATLRRSFASLLNGFIIEADGNSESPYYGLLTKQEQEYFFICALEYLNLEHDQTSYLEQYGFVHAYAHFGEFLAKVIQRQEFESYQDQLFVNFDYFFHNLPHPFCLGEERRLAYAIVSGLSTKSISQKRLARWLNELSFPISDPLSYKRRETFESFLSYIYFHAKKTISFTQELDTACLRFLNDYSLY